MIPETIIDDGGYQLADESLLENDITPRDRLKFAKTILLVLAVMFTLGALTELIHPQNNVFESCRTILPSFATLVIGYYFGKM
jgi:hypothetical protein